MVRIDKISLGMRLRGLLSMRTIKLCCCALLLAALSAQVSLSQEQKPDAAPVLKFDVASVRVSPPGNDRMFSMSQPGAPQLIFKNAPVSFLIGYAYGVDEYQVEGAPSWYTSELYDVSANAPTQGEQSDEQTKQRLQQLLAERFHLAFHREMKDMKGYALVPAKDVRSLKLAGPTRRVEASSMPISSRTE